MKKTLADLRAGVALGYIGGGALLAINLVMLKYPEWVGFPPGPSRSGLFPLRGFLVVDLLGPTFMFLHERGRDRSVPGSPSLREGYQRLRHTLARIRTFPNSRSFSLPF